MQVNQILELDRVEKAKTAGNIFMRFGVKKPIGASADAEPYLVGYAGFVPSAADLKFADAKWKFFKLKSKEDLTNAIKKMLADKTFTAAQGVTISIDSPAIANKFSYLGEFLSWVEKASKGKVTVEYKEKPQVDKVDNKVTVKNVKKKEPQSWGSSDARVEPAAKKITRHFTVTSSMLMNQLRKNERVMKYFKPNSNEFIMGPKEFDAFVKAFGRDDIKITKKFTEEIDEAFGRSFGSWSDEMNNASKKAKADAEEKSKKTGPVTSDTLKDINDKLGNNKKVKETATAGGTGAGSVATVANSKTKIKMQKPTDNALDMKDVSLFGGKAIKR